MHYIVMQYLLVALIYVILLYLVIANMYILVSRVVPLSGQLCFYPHIYNLMCAPDNEHFSRQSSIHNVRGAEFTYFKNIFLK